MGFKLFREALGITVYRLLNRYFLTQLMRITSELWEFCCLIKRFVFSQVFIKIVIRSAGQQCTHS